MMILVLLLLVRCAASWSITPLTTLGSGTDISTVGYVKGDVYTEMMVWITSSSELVGVWTEHIKSPDINLNPPSQFTIAPNASGSKLTKMKGQSPHIAILSYIDTQSGNTFIVRCNLRTKTTSAIMSTTVPETDRNRVVVSDSLGENLLSVSTVQNSIQMVPLLRFANNQSYYASNETIVFQEDGYTISQPSVATFLDNEIVVAYVKQNTTTTSIIAAIYEFADGLLSAIQSFPIGVGTSVPTVVSPHVAVTPNGGVAVTWKGGLVQYERLSRTEYVISQNRPIPCGNGTLQIAIDQVTSQPVLAWEDPGLENSVLATVDGSTFQIRGSGIQLLFLSEEFYAVTWSFKVGTIGHMYLVNSEPAKSRELVSTEVRDITGTIVVKQAWTGSDVVMFWDNGVGQTRVSIASDTRIVASSGGGIPAVCGSDGYILLVSGNPKSHVLTWNGTHDSVQTEPVNYSSTTQNQMSPSCVTTTGSNTYAVVWEDVDTSSVFLRGYDLPNNQVTPAIPFGKPNSSQPSITKLSSGDYFIVWTEDNKVVGGDFDVNGKQLTTVQIGALGGHSATVTAFRSGDKKLITWTDINGDAMYQILDSANSIIKEQWIGHFNKLSAVVLEDDSYILSYHHQLSGMAYPDVSDPSLDVLTILRLGMENGVAESMTLEGADGATVLGENGTLYIAYVNRSAFPGVYKSEITVSLGPILPHTYSPVTSVPIDTIAPTGVPTAVPTVSPTAAPTDIPSTDQPTAVPTEVPQNQTGLPTSVPDSTGVPTDVPTTSIPSTSTDVPNNGEPSGGGASVLIVIIIVATGIVFCLSLIFFVKRRRSRRGSTFDEEGAQISPLLDDPDPHSTVEMENTIDVHFDMMRRETNSSQKSDEKKLTPVSTMGRDININEIDWVPIKTLGTGTYGTVSLGVVEPGGSLMAVKAITVTPDSEILDKLRGEIRRMTRLSHPNVIKYLGEKFFPEEAKMNIFMEYVEGGSLHEMAIVKYLSECTVARLCKQALYGLEYIHNEGVIHRDIKGANILVGNHGRVVLADFGCSKDADTSWKSGNVAGTPSFMSPELVLSEGIPEYTPIVDIWAFGCTVVEILNKGRPPWPVFETPWAAFFHMANVYRSGGTPTQIPEKLSPECRDFVYSTFKPKGERPSASELLQHPYLRFEGEESSPMLLE
eukprot:TRINITY_DN847_c4_g1_i1.p1 TRINITY_DN847_c4_g1~~TRINITY_DN847_c4_g1_i1.p1  ORF type:complete len:1164 (+),score=161.34 TRINITY_DN847_c4_g1_i1:92-3583(+)